VAHSCNSNYLEGQDWNNHSLRSAWEKSSQDSFSTEKAGHAGTHLSQLLQEAKIGGSWSRPAWAKSETRSQK
jgi:hypothetical protein